MSGIVSAIRSTLVDRSAALAHPVEAAGWAVLFTAADTAARELGIKLDGAYALGSLAHGGFAPLVSDVDLALVLTELDDDCDVRMERVRRYAREKLGTPLAARLSLFWSTWNDLSGEYPRGRFPLVDRIDLAEAGRCVLAPTRAVSIRLPRGQTRHDALVIEAAEFMLAKVATPDHDALLLHPDVLIARSVRDVTKAVLFPVRFLYTADTGKADGNAAAAEWFMRCSSSHADSRRLVSAVMQWRHEGMPLVAVKPMLGPERLIGLYVTMIERYRKLTSALGRDDLSRALHAWQHRLSF